MPDLVRVDDLACAYDAGGPPLSWLFRRRRRVLRAVDGVSFTIARGETLGIVGESGSGKSTLGRLMVGLEPPTRGRVEFDGHLVRRPEEMPAATRHRMQMIFQDPYASLNPRWRARRIIGEPLAVKGGVRDRARRRGRVSELLRTVGLDEADGERYPREFSGGQRQRIAIARALAAEPDFIVCDEPTSALDVSVQAQVLNLMRALQMRLGLTALFISHNLAVIDHLADRVGVMYCGRIVELAPTVRLFARPRHPYTRMLLDALPALEGAGGRSGPIVGEPPDPLAPPTGCAFHPRCPLVHARCRREAPVLRATGDGAVAACHALDAA